MFVLLCSIIVHLSLEAIFGIIYTNKYLQFVYLEQALIAFFAYDPTRAMWCPFSVAAVLHRACSVAYQASKSVLPGLVTREPVLCAFHVAVCGITGGHISLPGAHKPSVCATVQRGAPVSDVCGSGRVVAICI